MLSPQKKKSEVQPCALHNFDTLRHILIIFGRNEEEDQQAYRVQERQPSLSLLSPIPEAEILCRP